MTNWFITFREGKKGSDFEEFPATEKLDAFREFLGKTHTESLVIAWLCMNYKKSEGKSVNRLFEKLSEKVSAKEITDAFTNLIALGLVQLNTDDFNSGSYNILFTHRVEVALRTGNMEVFKKKKVADHEDDRVTLRMYAHAVLFRAKITDVDDWVNISKVFLSYFDTEISKTIRRSKLDRLTQAVVLFVYVMHAVEGSTIECRFLAMLFSENKMQARRRLYAWKKSQWKPIQTGLLELRHYQMGPSALVPSDWVQQKVYGSGKDQINTIENIPSSLQIISAKMISQRHLFFNQKEAEQIDFLREMMMPANFKKYQQLRYKKGKPSGITVLLSGGPGTGKTEFARQAARMSGRDLIVFNVSEQRDKYFGESEKHIQQVFDCYADLVDSGRRIPVLFFNEADSIFQMRTSGGSSITNTENTIQTILLNELEQFNGILICTTNRPDSFDAAFSRRFDFKITIHPPTAPVRLQLLKQLCKKIPSERMAALADQYPFTGAELENFHKIYTMQSVIKKKNAQEDMATALSTYFASLFKKADSVIGFKTNQQMIHNL